MHQRTTRLSITLALATCLLPQLGRADAAPNHEAALAPTGNGEVVERVVAVVNGDPVFLSELRKRAVPFLPRIAQGTNSEAERYQAMRELYGELLTLLIDEQLIAHLARELQVSVTAQDIDRAIDNVRAGSGLSDPEFWEAVLEQGFTRDSYRADVRRQLVRMKVINQRVRSRVNITDEDVRRRYDEMVRRSRRNARFRVSQIFLPVSEESATEVAAVRARATAMRAELSAASFHARADELGGGELGWVSQGDLPEPLEDALLDLDVGAVSAPVRGPAGFHIFLLEERAAGDAGIGSYDEVRPELYRKMLDEAMAKQEAQFLKELRAQGLVARRL